MATKSTYSNLLKEKAVSKKPMAEEDMEVGEGTMKDPDMKLEAMEPDLKAPKLHTRGVRSPKAGKSKSTYAKMLNK